MKKVDDYTTGMLKGDVRTLEDISKVLEADGRYKVLPSILNGIADDIKGLFENEAKEG